MVFVIKDVAKTFGAGKDDIAWALTLTLALRPVGASSSGDLPIGSTAPGADGGCGAVFSAWFCNGLFPKSHRVPRHPRDVRCRYGRRVGIGASLTMEKTAPQARASYPACCNPAIQRLSAGVACLSQFLRSARPLVGMESWRDASDRRSASAPHSLYPSSRSGISRLVERSCEDRHCSGMSFGTIGNWALYAILLMTAPTSSATARRTSIRPSAHHFDVHTTGNIAIA